MADVLGLDSRPDVEPFDVASDPVDEEAPPDPSDSFESLIDDEEGQEIGPHARRRRNPFRYYTRRRYVPPTYDERIAILRAIALLVIGSIILVVGLCILFNVIGGSDVHSRYTFFFLFFLSLST